MDIFWNICTGLGAFVFGLTTIILVWGLVLSITGKVAETRDRDELIKLLDPDARLKRVDDLIKELEERKVISDGLDIKEEETKASDISTTKSGD